MFIWYKWKFDFDQSIIKSTLLEEQCMFSVFSIGGIFLKIRTCNIVPHCYKCWKFSFDKFIFKGTLYVDQYKFLPVSQLPLEGFHYIHA
jgi:hypothetical protein